MERTLLLGLRVVVGAVFLYAAVDKIVHPDRFADVVWDYNLLPAALVNPFAVCLPWVELVAGLLLVTGAWVPSTALLTAGLTVMFLVAVGINLARGADGFHCGCFSTTQEGPSEAWSLMWRDALLLAAAVVLFWRSWRAQGQV
jgi:uncharacterized membrane protein YphA (DoxX/SURF4 family)